MEKTPTIAGGSTASPLPGTAPSGQPTNVAVGGSALASVPKFGGNRGGKPRTDGLVPGSPEALAADRAKDAERKRAERAKLRASSPPPLPSALPTGSNSPDAQSDNQGTGVSAPISTDVPWVTDDIRPLLDELIPLLEQESIESRAQRAREGNLPTKVVAEIEKDARWKEFTKLGLSRGGSEILIKWLNRLGVSTANKGEITFALAFVHMLLHNRKIDRRIDTMIQEMSPAQPQPNDKTQDKK